jgi:carboxymethylenebutenolidase
MLGMCFPIDALPPLPPIVGGSSDATDLMLKASDGKQAAAYAVRAAKPTGAGVAIIPDPRGLAPFYKELTTRFAETGIDTIAIDYLTRHGVPNPRPDNFDFMSAIGLVRSDPDGVDADVAAAIAYLRSQAGGQVASVFTVGFCFGGSTSWRQSARQADLAGAIGFYGRPSMVTEFIPQMKAPLLVLAAGADQATTPEDNAAFDRQLTEAKVPHKTVVYPGAPHSFFDRSFEQHKEASEDAWRQTLSFIKEYTRASVPSPSGGG